MEGKEELFNAIFSPLPSISSIPRLSLFLLMTKNTRGDLICQKNYMATQAKF